MERSLLRQVSALSFSVVDHLRWDLSQIFNLARSEGAIHRNPAEFLVTPKNAAKPERSVMSREDVKKCVEVLPLRERLIFKAKEIQRYNGDVALIIFSNGELFWTKIKT